MGCIETKMTNTNANLAIFQILQEYPKIRKELRKSLNLKDYKWNSWTICFQNNVYPSDFLSSSSEKKITKKNTGILVEPLWSGRRNIFFFYRDDKGSLSVAHITLPGNIFDNPIEITTTKKIQNIDDKVMRILITRSWFFLMER